LLQRKNLRRVCNAQVQAKAGITSDHSVIEMELRIAAYIPKKDENLTAQERNDSHKEEKEERKQITRINWKLLLTKTVEGRKEFNNELLQQIKAICAENPEMATIY
jgi:hypothetical protein